VTADDRAALGATVDYDVRRLDHIAALDAVVPAEVAKRSWTLEQFAAERDRRLQALVAWARDRSPWHRERLADIHPRDLTATTITELPTMTKADLMAHWDDIVTDRRVTLALAERALELAADGTPTYLFDEHQVVATGGSSGTRGVFVWDFAGLVAGMAPARRFAAWVNSEVTSPSPPKRVARVQATNPGHISFLVARCFSGPHLPGLHLSPSAPLPELIRELAEFQPDALVGYPSLLGTLAQAVLDGQLRVPVRRVTSQAEPLPPETRALLEEAFGVVTEIYGATECLNLAHGWPGEDHLRLAEDNAVLEPLAADGAPITAPQEPSVRTLLTNLGNRVLPLIRYELGDELTWVDSDMDTDAVAGRPGRACRISGRSDDVFRYGDLTIHPHSIRSALGRREIVEYQVRQTSTGLEVALRAAGVADVEAIGASLEQVLRRAGLPAPVVRVREVDQLERTQRTGKLRRFVPLAGS
jgi:phenylacetate-CoA ligase